MRLFHLFPDDYGFIQNTVDEVFFTNLLLAILKFS